MSFVLNIRYILGKEAQVDEEIVVPEYSDIADISIEDTVSLSGEDIPDIQPVISRHSSDWRWLEAIKKSKPALEDQKPEIKISTADILQNMKASIDKDNSDRVLKPKNNVNNELDNEIEKMRDELIEQMGKSVGHGNKRKRATSKSTRSENIRRPSKQCKDSSLTQHPKPITWQPARADSLQPSAHGKNRNLDGPSGSQSKSRYETRDSRSQSNKSSGSRSKSRSRSRYNYRQSDRSPLRKSRKSKSKSPDRCSSKSKRSPLRKISFSSQSKSRSKSRDSRIGSRRKTRERSSSGESCRARSRSRISQEHHEFIDNEGKERRVEIRNTNKNHWKPNKNVQERMALDVDLESYFSSHPQQETRKPYERQTEFKENENQQFSSREASVFNRLGPPK